MFLSPDSFIQAATYSQNYNRYSYVLNNPIRYNDPSGHVIVLVAAIVLAMVEVWYVAMMLAFMFAMIESHGDVKYSLIMAVSTGVAFEVGTIFQGAKAFSAQFFAKSLVHGLTQGIFSEAMGGDFKSGFIGGFLGSVSGGFKIQNPVVSTVVAAMAGGTVSELSGGKFRNGARSAAIVHVFNDLKHQNEGNNSGSSNGSDPTGNNNAPNHGGAINQSFGSSTGSKVRNGLIATGGAVQAVVGFGLCDTGLGCVLGAPLMAVGITNIGEGVSGLNNPSGEGFNILTGALEQGLSERNAVAANGIINLSLDLATLNMPSVVSKAPYLHIRYTSKYEYVIDVWRAKYTMTPLAIGGQAGTTVITTGATLSGMQN